MNKKTAKTTTKKATTKKAAKKPTTKKAAKKPTTKKAAKKKTTTKKAAKKTTTTKKAAQKATKAVVPPGAGTPEVGALAPAFSLPGDDGKTHSLAGHRGHPVVLYFYPKDDTPGCTVEACDFRDNMARVQQKGAVVLGVSRDGLQSHSRFAAKFNLNFPLLSDPGLDAHRAYGAWGKKVMYGKEVEGALRSTFLIDAEGILRASWPRVKVDGHVDEVLNALHAL